MLKHYFKIALRNIFKYKAYTIISAVCIALGMITISFPYLYTYMDYNNKFINNHYYDLEFQNVLNDTLNSYDFRARTQISENEFGQIDSNNLNLFSKVVLVAERYFIGNKRPEVNIEYKDTEENILPIKASVSYSNNEMLINENTSFLYGNRLINAPDEVIISKNFAKKISIGKNPVGASIIYDNQSYKIINVLNDDKITDKADLYLSIKGKELISKTNEIRVFVSLKEGVTKTSVNKVLNSSNIKIGDKQLKLKVVDIREYEDINYIKGITLLLTSLILISALVTFLKYTFQIFYSKQRELVLRKISGSNAKGLFLLLYVEIFCVLAFAYFLSLVFVEVIFVFSSGVKFFGELFEIVSFKQIFYVHTIIILCVLLISFVLVLIPIKKVRRISLVYTLNFKRRHNITRLVLIWLQLVISSVLLLLIVVVAYVKEHNSGYDTLSKKEKSKIIVVSLNSSAIKRNWNSIKNEIVNLPQIEHFAAESMNLTTNAIVLNSDTIRVRSICGNSNYFNMFNIPFKGKLLNDNESGYVYVNEALSELLKENDNSGTIDIDGITYQMAGVYQNLYQKKVYDYNYSVFFINNNPDRYFFKISMNNNEKEEIKNIEKIIRKYVPQTIPLSINTLNIEMEIQYGYWILFTLTLISIVLVILSIYTSISMEVRHRQKEMALRKINGATPKNIAVIFIKSYIVVFLFSFLSSFIIITRYYSEHSLYPYLCDWKNIFISFLIILVILLLTTYWQIKKIMNVNPAEVLRKE